MGHRANLLLVDDTGYQLFYCHWCANTLPRDLFWGPEIAELYVSQQRSCPDDSGWLNLTWAEGGAVIDRIHKQLLLFGGQTLKDDIPLRRLYLTLLRHVWKGWNVHWAYDGILEIADYVGHSRDNLFVPEESRSSELFLREPDEPDWIDLIASIRLENGDIRFFPLDGFVGNKLLYGQRLVNAMREKAYLPALLLDQTDRTFPTSGFHIDLPNKTVSFWAAYAPGVMQDISQHWVGWRLNWLKDSFEGHLTLAQNRLRFPSISNERLLSELESLLLSERPGAVPGFLKMLEQFRQEGKEIKINPDALHESPLKLEMEFRRRVFTETVEAWKKDLNI